MSSYTSKKDGSEQDDFSPDVSTNSNTFHGFSMPIHNSVKQTNNHNSNESDKYVPERTFRNALPQILATSAKNCLLLTYGMTLGLPTIAIPALYTKNASNEKFSDTLQLTREQISWFSSINLICVPLGCIMSGALTQPFGRKPSMVMLNLPFIMAWLLFHNASTVVELYLALAICGLCGGLLEAPVLTYVAEITQPHLRGVLSASASTTVILGTMSQFVMGNFLHWRKVALINTFIPICALISLLFIPESPHWLISKGRVADAEKSLCWLRGWVNPEKVQFELSTIRKSIAMNKEKIKMKKNKKFYSFYIKRTFLLPYFIITATFFFGHFGGMTTLQTNAVQIFETLGSPISGYASTLILGMAQLMGGILCLTLIHWTGKRPLAIISTLGTSLCFFIVSGYAYMRQYNIELTNNNTWIPVVFLNMAAFMTHISIRLLPWMLIGEVYPPNIRGPASGASGSSSYIFAFTANKSYFMILDHINLFGTFLLYASVSIIGCIVLYIMMPETEGICLEDIQEHFANKSKTFAKKITKSDRNEEIKQWAATNPALEIEQIESHL
ncbi:facilitated trehalose transporter Tret1-like [Adelges cooleyi]|uniref:facilitated trehalose transporter Tret1-like n=1 Tax=Adelges cooleyi TaxID=133065 RepID=UPI00217FA0A4|nr:facilitated trehalose transporter Tret1-like [Adelges cooleyi]